MRAPEAPTAPLESHRGDGEPAAGDAIRVAPGIIGVLQLFDGDEDVTKMSDEELRELESRAARASPAAAVD